MVKDFFVIVEKKISALSELKANLSLITHK
jgi:hypothetical protein